MNAIAEQLKRAGYDPREVEIKKAIALWQNNGGTLDRLIEIASAAYGAGHTAGAAHTETVRANSGGAAIDGVPKGHGGIAAPRGPSQADLAAKRKGAKSQAQAVTKAVASLGFLAGNVPGGPAYLELRVRDLDGMTRRQFAEGAVHGHSGIALMLIAEEISKRGEVDPEAKIGEVLDAPTLQRLARKLEADSLKPMIGDALKLVGNFVDNSLKEITHAGQ